MPLHLVESSVIKAGRLKRLNLKENNAWDLPDLCVHDRNRSPGRAGRMLIEDLRQRLAACPASFTPRKK